MKKNNGNRNLIRERFTILLVMFFCALISSAEFIPIESPSENPTEQQDHKQVPDSENQTFLDVATDAVVPFVFGTVNHVFHLIYEIIGFETAKFQWSSYNTQYTNHFFEILQERIISTNAP